MKKPIAIVLAGSGENRVAEAYYGKPQELHTATILSSMGLETYISKRSESDHDCTYGVLSDKYPEQGAIHAILSLMSELEVNTALMVPCDMPLLDAELLEQLLSTYVEEDTIVCFRQHGTPYIEPFPAIFEKAVLELLVTDVVEGKISLQDLLKHTGSHLIEIPKDNRLLNVSEEVEKKEIIRLLSNK